MQFREQGRKIQCVRATYDTQAKRTHQRVIASFDRHADEVPATGLEDLTAAELKQLAAWLDDVRQAKRQAIAHDRIVGVPGELVLLVDAINSNGIDLDQAASILASLDLVKKAIKRTLSAKCEKLPAEEKSGAKASVDPRQQPLLDIGQPATTP